MDKKCVVVLKGGRFFVSLVMLSVYYKAASVDYKTKRKRFRDIYQAGQQYEKVA